MIVYVAKTPGVIRELCGFSSRTEIASCQHLFYLFRAKIIASLDLAKFSRADNEDKFNQKWQLSGTVSAFI